MKREDQIEDEIQYAYCPERNMTWTLIFTSALRKSDIHYLQSYSHSFVVIISFVDKRAMLFRVKGVSLQPRNCRVR